MLGKQFNWRRDPSKPPVWYIEGERLALGRPRGKWSQKYARATAPILPVREPRVKPPKNQRYKVKGRPSADVMFIDEAHEL